METENDEKNDMMKSYRKDIKLYLNLILTVQSHAPHSKVSCKSPSQSERFGGFVRSDLSDCYAADDKRVLQPT